jgi:FMN reductase
MKERPLQQTARLVLISGGVSEPSSTRLLADRTGAKVIEALTADDIAVRSSVIELAPLSADIGTAMVGGLSSERLRSALSIVAEADIVVASTPIYKGGISGLFKSFVDVMDNDLIVGKTVVLAATAGSARHAMVVDDHMRPLFAFMRAVTVPTSVFAAPEDWADPSLGRRLKRAAVEAAALHGSGLEQRVVEQSWDGYQHQFGGSSVHAGEAGGVDFDTPLMRLAAGGAHNGS